jgi:hypothetical protein
LRENLSLAGGDFTGKYLTAGFTLISRKMPKEKLNLEGV